jgi:predicted dehydrogenase
MLEKEKPELVTVGPRWTIHHKEYLDAAAAIGAHGFLEKPISSDLVEADAMIRTIEAKNLKWAIGFNFRVLPIVEHARRLVMEQGIIGEVLEVRGRGKEDKRAGGEDLIVLGTHIFDLMRYFVGDARWCMSNITVGGRAAVRTDVHEATEPLGPIAGDRIHASFGFDKGIVGHFASTSSEGGNGGRWGLDIFGSKGIVSIRQDPNPRVSLLREPSWTPLENGAAWEALPDAPTVEMKNPELERYASILDDLLASIGTDRLPRVSLQDGRASLEMIQAVYEAHIRSARVEFPLKERTHPLTRWPLVVAPSP